MTVSMPLAFLLVKKSTYVSSQVAKFIKFGKNNDMMLSQKVKDAFEKSNFFGPISTIIDRVMMSNQGKFRQLLT